MASTVYSPAALNAQRRSQDIEALAEAEEPVDILVIGGGITGAGIALDAASRGLNTVLVEKKDIAFGTSRWSSKLAHGGLRYLTKLEVGIAHNSAVERGILMEKSAPHLVKALPQVTPLANDTHLFQKAAVRAGYIAGDLLRITAGTSSRTLARSRYVNVEGTLKLCPQTLLSGLRGSWVNFDGQMVDDARLVSAVVRTAAEKGARILTYCEVLEATGEGIKVRDHIGEATFEIAAKAVISAVGVWAQSLDREIKVRPARGTHLVFDAKTFGNPTGALTVPLEGSISRYLFILPAPHGRCYLGLTDNEAPEEIPDVPPTPDEDIDSLLNGINRSLENPVSRKDIRGAFTGLRPLIDMGDVGVNTADLSRRHAIIDSPTGLISVVGGKFTEYRLMAEQAVNHAVKKAQLEASSCRTRYLPLVGAPRHPIYGHVSASEMVGLPETLRARFGHESREVVDSCPVERPLDCLEGCKDVTRAEIAYAITHEGAMSVDDILDRRTRIGLVKEDRKKVEPEVSEIFDSVSAESK